MLFLFGKAAPKKVRMRQCLFLKSRFLRLPILILTRRVFKSFVFQVFHQWVRLVFPQLLEPVRAPEPPDQYRRNPAINRNENTTV